MSLGPLAGFASDDVLFHISLLARTPVVPGNELVCLVLAWVFGIWMLWSNDVHLQDPILGYADVTLPRSASISQRDDLVVRPFLTDVRQWTYLPNER